ncbi:orotate phosphoribosyltransferase [Pseudogracilibacillus sp. SE30717A]|uniref:orotate phosphoribosyltransferase n=1 Tax=Pseudogracilibacillus sp. SE30717A TaxID=3098293 RepID=UPI00300E209F
MELQNEIARDLLNIKAVQIKTDSFFTWTSGIQSPIYCDNRLTMSYPAIRQKITKAFIQKLQDLNIKPDIIAGCATAGIPHAAWLANELNIPMIYVRSKPKGHGKGNQIEGKVEKGQKIVVIEDLISTGGSSLETANVLRSKGLDVQAILAIFTYGLEVSDKRFKEENLPAFTITSFDKLLDVLVTDDEITEVDRKKLLKWRDQL